MAHTFDIRFDAAGNTLGWKGGGRLHIDAQGLSFALKRGIASLLARKKSQRIPAETIREVYREGEVLRVEFATDQIPRATLPFRVRDRDTAARIVQLLPTSRTIELERTTGAPAERRGGRMPLVLGAIALLAGAVLFTVMRPAPGLPGPADGPLQTDAAIQAPTVRATDSPSRAVSSSAEAAPMAAAPAGEPITPDEARKLAMLAEDPVDWTQPPPRSRPSSAPAAEAERQARFERMTASLPAAETSQPVVEREVDAFVPMEVPDIDVHADMNVVRIPQTSLAYASARGLLGAFEASAKVLTADYENEFERFSRGTLDARTFANRLDALELRWRGVGERIVGTRKYDDPAIAGLRAGLLNVAIEQRVFLGGYAAGLRTDDQRRIERAFKALVRADEALRRARNFVN